MLVVKPATGWAFPVLPNAPWKSSEAPSVANFEDVQRSIAFKQLLDLNPVSKRRYIARGSSRFHPACMESSSRMSQSIAAEICDAHSPCIHQSDLAKLFLREGIARCLSKQKGPSRA